MLGGRLYLLVSLTCLVPDRYQGWISHWLRFPKKGRRAGFHLVLSRISTGALFADLDQMVGDFVELLGAEHELAWRCRQVCGLLKREIRRVVGLGWGGEGG